MCHRHTSGSPCAVSRRRTATGDRTYVRTPVLVLLAVLAALSGCGEAAGTASTARVVRVVDGDTVRVVQDGREEAVRYIGIDTPESVKPGSPVECFGKAASRANARLVEGERVRLVEDVESHDRYGRRLAYVYRLRDGLFVNAELVRRGFATPATYPPNVAHADRFAELARAARRERRGLWSACR
jgi:micrococcal nuclease